jgi:hypothetical protein
LESVCRGNSTVGSNPTLSAILKIVPSNSTNPIRAKECYIFFGNCRALHSLAARRPDGHSHCLLPAKDRGNRWRYRPLTLGRRPEAAKSGPYFIRLRYGAGRYQWVEHDTEQAAEKAAMVGPVARQAQDGGDELAALWLRPNENQELTRPQVARSHPNLSRPRNA